MRVGGDGSGWSGRHPYNSVGTEKFPDKLEDRKKPRLPRWTPVAAERVIPDEHFMRLALREAERALGHEDVPVGAVVVVDGEVVGAGHNERELRQDPTAHAELLALREAARHLGTWRILDSALFVTLEPCAMCAGAIVLARVGRVVYGTADPKAGAAGSVIDILGERRFNHRPEVSGGLLREECAALLVDFFASRR
jgi:tRNA(adenine34) deaminase